MKDGIYCYTLEMTAPLGLRRGKLRLVVQGRLVSGELTMFTRTLPILEGHCEANRLSFSGDMKTLMETIPYAADGTVTGSRIDLLFTTCKGSYPAVGQQEITGQRREAAT